MKIRFILCLFLAYLVPPCLIGQVSEKAIPPSFMLQGLQGDVPVATMRLLDFAAIQLQDEQDAAENRSPRFGFPIEVDYSTSNSGLWEQLPNGDRMWRLKIVSQGALSLNLGFDLFHLPDGAQLFLYDDSYAQLLGAYTSRNNRPGRGFATSFIKADHLNLEYYEPAAVQGQGLLHLNKVVHGYYHIGGSSSRDFGDSGPCHINTSCDEATAWKNQIKSVGLYLVDGFRWCSGTLINNAKQDCRPYFLSANHCLGVPGLDLHAGDTLDWVFMFNYESPDCSPTTDGPTTQTVQGAIIRATSPDTDFTLFELLDAPQAYYDVYYAGWDRNIAPPISAIGIHHPSGDVKKISFDNAPAVDATGEFGFFDTHWKVVWDLGSTEPGSSGSGLFNQNGLLIGQLTGGDAGCIDTVSNNGGYDIFGKIFQSWDMVGTTSADRLQDWLDPENTGIEVLDGVNCTMIAPQPDFEANATSLCLDITDTLSFADLSSPPADTWLWTFEGGFPASSTEQNPIVVYPQEGTYAVSLTVSNTYGSNTLALDDFVSVVSGANCQCLTPTGVNITVADNTASIYWTAGSSIGTGWTLEYGPIGFEPGQGTLLTTSEPIVIIQDLDFSTGYAFNVTEDCTIAGISAPSNFVTFYTSCANGAQNCSLYLNLFDTGDDGWDDAFVNVNQGGVSTSYTIPYDFLTGGSDTIYVIENCEGTSFSLSYSSGDYEEEHLYALLNASGDTLFSDGPNPATGVVYSGVLECSPSSVKEQSNLVKDQLQKTTLFPLPAHDFVNLKINAESGKIVYLQMHSIMGQLLMEQVFEVPVTGELISINVSQLPAGIYCIWLDNGTEKVCKKLVKK